MKHSKKIYGVGIIALSLLFISPQKTEAQWPVFDIPTEVSTAIGATAETSNAVKEYGLDAVAYFFANRMVEKIAAQTVNWINSGFEGNPAYVTNPEQFFLDVGDDTASKVLSSTALNQLCSPFKAQVRLALVKNYINDNQNFSCTLSKVKDNYDQFTQDFRQGGWEGWFEVTQNSNNNPYGAYFDYQGTLGRQVGAATEQLNKEIAQGAGFLSFKTCPDGQTVTQADIDNSITDPNLCDPDLGCSAPNPYDGYKVGDCKVKKETATPGSVISSSLNKVLHSGTDRINAADEIDEIIGALLGQLIDRIVGGIGDGLRGASKPDQNGQSFTDRLANAPPQTPSNPGGRVVCTTPPDTIDEEGNTVPGVTDCQLIPPAPPPPPPPPPQVICTTDTNGVTTCKVDDGSGSPPSGPSVCGAGNDFGPPAPIASDFSNVVIDSGKDASDIGSWSTSNSVTLNSVTFPGNSTICLNHTMPWPSAWTQPTSLASDGSVPASAWVFIWRGGKWHAATFEYYYRDGSEAECRDDGSVWSNAGFSPDFAPRTGETYGFMISGLARAGHRNVSERTNIIMQQWAGRLCTSPSGPPSPTNPTCTPPKVLQGNKCVDPSAADPIITSVSPTNTKRGETTITITGTNLTDVVRFYNDNAGGTRESVVGSVNSAKTQTTVLVPASIPTGNVRVVIYRPKNGDIPNIESNSKLIQVESGVSPEPTPTVTSFDATTGNRGQLAYNPISNTWMVVSALDEIWARIMKNDGTATGAQFKINQTSGVQVMSPKIAYATNINKYLVVWLGFPDPSGGTIYGRLINADGTSGGSAFTIFKDPPGGASFFYTNSALRYDSKNKKFVLVWEYRHPDVDINLVTIDSTGTVGTVINVGQGLAVNSNSPSLAINESADEYCVAYDRRSDPTPKLATRKVNAMTGVLGPETTTSIVGLDTTLAYNSVNGKYLVGWSDATTPTTKGKILNSCNMADGGTIFTLSSVGKTANVSYNSRSNNYAVIVQNQNDSGNSYAILNSSGTRIGGGVAFVGGFGNFAPVIAPNTSDGKFSAISSIEYKTTRFAPNLGPTGTSSTTPAPIPTYTDLGDGAFPDVVWYNSRLWVAYRGPNSATINLYSFDSNLGDKKTEKIIPTSGGAGGFPRLTVSNGTLWMAWRDGEPSGEDIKLWRKDLDSTESLGPGAGNDPVALGYGYIAWQKLESPNWRVYRRPLAGGTSVFLQNGLPTGISRILSTGLIKTIDQDRTAVSWGVNAWFSGAITVATDITPKDDNGVAVRLNNLASSEFNLWPGQRTHTPHAATDGNGNYAVATWNPTVRVAVFKKQ
ncbi:MAG TPA: hypothetical protein VJG67_04050 [Candidatus Paceibacterota bacterium]